MAFRKCGETCRRLTRRQTKTNKKHTKKRNKELQPLAHTNQQIKSTTHTPQCRAPKVKTRPETRRLQARRETTVRSYYCIIYICSITHTFKEFEDPTAMGRSASRGASIFNTATSLSGSYPCAVKNKQKRGRRSARTTYKARSASFTPYRTDRHEKKKTSNGPRQRRRKKERHRQRPQPKMQGGKESYSTITTRGP